MPWGRRPDSGRVAGNRGHAAGFRPLAGPRPPAPEGRQGGNRCLAAQRTHPCVLPMPAPVIPNPLACPEHCPRHCSGTGGALPDSAGENDGGARRPVSGGGGGSDQCRGEGATRGAGRTACRGSERHTMATSGRVHGSSPVSGAPAGTCRRRSKTACSVMPAPNAAVSEAPRTSREPVPAPCRRWPPPARAVSRWRWILRGVKPMRPWRLPLGYQAPRSVPRFAEHEPGCGAGRRSMHLVPARMVLNSGGVSMPI